MLCGVPYPREFEALYSTTMGASRGRWRGGGGCHPRSKNHAPCWGSQDDKCYVGCRTLVNSRLCILLRWALRAVAGAAEADVIPGPKITSRVGGLRMTNAMWGAVPS